MLGRRETLDTSARSKIAFDIALGAQWDGFTAELQNIADPTVVKVILLGAMVAYMATIALPEVFTKGVAAVVTVVLTSYLGAETVWNLVGGDTDGAGSRLRDEFRPTASCG